MSGGEWLNYAKVWEFFRGSLTIISNKKWVVSSALVMLLCVAAVTIEVPDWGHVDPADKLFRHPFAHRLPDEVRNTPATYLIAGPLTSFIVPSFHPDSRFYRIDFSTKIFPLIESRLADEKQPLRVLFSDVRPGQIRQLLGRLKIPQNTTLTCQQTRSIGSAYTICDIDEQESSALANADPIRVDFMKDANFSHDLFATTGMGQREPWGRWTDSELAAIEFNRCLPVGVLRVKIEALAFTAVANQPVELAIGKSHASVTLQTYPRRKVVKLVNDASCETVLWLHVPASKSPSDLGLSPDQRKLGVGLVKLQIKPVGHRRQVDAQ